jgi:hypothetical protein
LERIERVLERMTLPCPLVGHEPPYRHTERLFVPLSERYVFKVFAHTVLPDTFVNIVNSASTEDFEQLIQEAPARKMVGILERLRRPRADH